MSQEITFFSLEDDKVSTQQPFQTFQKRTRPIKKANFIGLQEDNRKKSKKKHWKPSQNIQYMKFLIQHGHLFAKDREDKRVMKINLMMSKFVRTKNSTQCHSHHQKMVQHHKSIAGIIAFFQHQLFGRNPIEQHKEKLTTEDQSQMVTKIEEEPMTSVDGKNQEQVIDLAQQESEDFNQYFSF